MMRMYYFVAGFCSRKRSQHINGNAFHKGANIDSFQLCYILLWASFLGANITISAPFLYILSALGPFPDTAKRLSNSQVTRRLGIVQLLQDFTSQRLG